jgi:hypothetical protein
MHSLPVVLGYTSSSVFTDVVGIACIQIQHYRVVLINTSVYWYCWQIIRIQSNIFRRRFVRPQAISLHSNTLHLLIALCASYGRNWILHVLDVRWHTFPGSCAFSKCVGWLNVQWQLLVKMSSRMGPINVSLRTRKPECSSISTKKWKYVLPL